MYKSNHLVRHHRCPFSHEMSSFLPSTHISTYTHTSSKSVNINHEPHRHAFRKYGPLNGILKIVKLHVGLVVGGMQSDLVLSVKASNDHTLINIL